MQHTAYKLHTNPTHLPHIPRYTNITHKHKTFIKNIPHDHTYNILKTLQTHIHTPCTTTHTLATRILHTHLHHTYMRHTMHTLHTPHMHIYHKCNTPHTHYAYTTNISNTDHTCPIYPQLYPLKQYYHTQHIYNTQLPNHHTYTIYTHTPHIHHTHQTYTTYTDDTCHLLHI